MLNGLNYRRLDCLTNSRKQAAGVFHDDTFGLAIMIFPFMPTQSINEAFQAAKDQWQTCDWPMEFGTLQLNVTDLRSFHAERLSRATSGDESREWQKATDWLRKIEADAAIAQQLASQALEACAAGLRSPASELIAKACQIEAVWHSELVWGSLQQAILQSFDDNAACES